MLIQLLLVILFLWPAENNRLFGQVAAPIKAEKQVPLVPYRKGDKWGIADTSGNFIVPPKFTAIRITSTGNFIIKKGKKAALANKDGKLLTPFKYTFISDFGSAQAVNIYKPDVLAYVQVNEKKGIIDTLGNEVMPPIYPLAYSLGGGLFSAGFRTKSPLPGRSDRKVGLFKSGGIPLSPISYFQIERKPSGYLQFDDFYSFKTGLANPQGKMIIPVEQLVIHDISEGIIAAWVSDNQSIMKYNGYNFFDSTGSVAINKQFTFVEKNENQQSFVEGFAPVANQNKWGYIDKTGKLVIPLKYDYAIPFRNGLAIVKQGGKDGLIDKNQTIIVPFEYSFLKWHKDGFLTANNEQGKGVSIILKRSSKGITPVFYDYIAFYYENLAFAEKNGKFGYLDREGNVQIPFIYEKGANFNNGFASVKKDGKWGFIDTTGAVRFPFIYDDRNAGKYSFYYERAAVKLNGKWTYIDKKGKAITNYLDYGSSYPMPFENGLAKIWAYKKGAEPYNRVLSPHTLIDTTGKKITDLEFSKIGHFENGMAEVCQGSSCGLIDTTGKLILPMVYEFIPTSKPVSALTKTEYSIFHNGLLLVRDPQTKKVLGYINKAGKQFWED